MPRINLKLYKRIRTLDISTCKGCTFEASDSNGEGICLADGDESISSPQDLGCIDSGVGYIFISIPQILKQL